MDQQQYQQLLDPNNTTAFQQLVSALLSPDNALRGAAENVFQQLNTGSPDTCATHLIQTLRHCKEPQMRIFSAVMLRKILTRDEQSLWERLTPSCKAGVKQELLASIKEEPQQTVVKKICHCVSELGSSILDSSKPGDGWDELLPFMFQCVQSGEERLMEAALTIYASLASVITSSLRAHLGTMYTVLSACLSHTSVAVRLAALQAVGAFVQSLSEASDRNQFLPLLPAMLGVVSHALNARDEVAATEAMELFIEIADTQPRFLKKELSAILEAFLRVARAQELEDSTRQTAAELLVCLCDQREKAPGMMRKQVEFVAALFETLMLYLLDIEDTPRWHSADTDAHEDEGEGQLYEFGQECLDRISLSLGGKTIVPLAGRCLPTWLQSPDWEKRHATLICLAQVAEGCSKVMSESLEQLTAMCVTGLGDPHPKVRWAACQAAGQMCTDLGPEIQTTQHARILPALMLIMDDFANPRVQAHACAAMVNFSENCGKDVMSSYLNDLIQRLLQLLQNGKKMAQEGALTAMASVADCAQDAFEQHYDVVMPLLRHILASATDKTHQLLRAKALECISLVGMAVGKERFRADAQSIMSLLHELHSSELDADDPTTSYMHQAGARLCKCMGQEFVPFLQVVMPSLLKAAQLKPDVQINDADDVEGDDEDDVEVIMLGDKKIQIKTSTLDEKAMACNMLCCYADELKEHFVSYVQPVLAIMVPCLTFYIHEEVRKAAVQSLPELLRSTVRAMDLQMGPTPAHVEQVLRSMWSPLLECIPKEPDMEVLGFMIEALDEMVELGGNWGLDAAQIGEGFMQLGGVLAKVEERRQERAQQQEAEDFDEEEAEALAEETEMDEDLIDQVGSCIGCLLKTYGDAALPHLETLMPAVGALLDDSRSHECKRIAVCIIDDLLEHSPQGAGKYGASFLPILLHSAVDPVSPDLRQCAVYGLGMVAAKLPALVVANAEAVVGALVTVIQAPGAEEDHCALATDNAVSALGRVLLVPGAPVDLAALTTLWVSSLPLRHDTVEACTVHDQLFGMVEAGHALLLPHLEAVGRVAVAVLAAGRDRLVSPEAAPKAVAFLKVQGNQGESIQAAVEALSPAERQCFDAYLYS